MNSLEIIRLSSLAGFEKLPFEFATKQLKEWRAVYDHDAPHKQKLPGHWDDDLNEDDGGGSASSSRLSSVTKEQYDAL